MKCPLCNTELRIKKSRNLVEIDGDTPRLYIQFDMTCGNRNCSNYDTVLEQTKNEQPIG